MNDVEKTNIERKNSGKRMRRRRRMMSVYAFIVIVLVLTAGVTMCLTFLFNIDEIIVSGESKDYTALQIVEASKVKAGDNLIRLDKEKAEKNILKRLIYVETASVDKDFPSTLRVNVTRCIPAYNVQYENRVLLVSRKGKILSDSDNYTDPENLPIIQGFEPKKLTEGADLKSENANKDEAFAQIISRFDRDDNTNIASIDMTNEYDIVVEYRDGTIFKMGNWSDVDYKLDLAQTVMNDESVKGKSGYLTMVGKNQCSFRSSGEKETIVTTAASTDAQGLITPETTTTVVTSAAAEAYGF
ncbi:MAG: FtsQ-type POTRA domain-containing protein [Ruminococcus sp.]|nr:FtsQ-type POTRA domain-containing protein [Ruminococcus sp.]